MALLTTGAIATALGMAWNYWRIPVRLHQWRKADEVEPAVGQTWREAGFSPKHSDFKVLKVDDEGIGLKSTTNKDAFGDYLEHDMNWETWAIFVKKRRLYCKDKNESMEDKYFGEHSED